MALGCAAGDGSTARLMEGKFFLASPSPRALRLHAGGDVRISQPAGHLRSNGHVLGSWSQRQSWMPWLSPGPPPPRWTARGALRPHGRRLVGGVVVTVVRLRLRRWEAVH
jgi:hypothetical protein